MKTEWRRVCAPELAKCKKSKTKTKRRKELQVLFFSQYVIKSKLYKEGEIKQVENMSGKEARDRAMLLNVEGGKYNKQVVSNLLLENQ